MLIRFCIVLSIIVQNFRKIWWIFQFDMIFSSESITLVQYTSFSILSCSAYHIKNSLKNSYMRISIYVIWATGQIIHSLEYHCTQFPKDMMHISILYDFFLRECQLSECWRAIRTSVLAHTWLSRHHSVFFSYRLVNAFFNIYI